jgi:F0F1-type ATP synthase delta subunit
MTEGQVPKLFSAFELNAKAAKPATEAVKKLLGVDPDGDVSVDETLICGIECRVGGVNIGWSAAGWLDILSREVEDALDRQTETPAVDSKKAEAKK